MHFQHFSRILFPLIPLSLIFSNRINAYVIILYVISVLFQEGLNARFRKALRQKWIYPFIALYFLHLISLLWSQDLETGTYILEKKASILALPLIICMDGQLNAGIIKKSFLSLIFGSCLALLYCLVIASINYFQSGETYYFFYHDLGEPLKLNAVYFSLYFVIALSLIPFLYKQSGTGVNWGPIAFFSVSILLFAGIILLSSKLFVSLLLCFFILLILKSKKGALRKRSNKAFVLASGMLVLAGTIFFLKLPKDRFLELAHTDMAVLQQEQFSWETHFNGLTLRLLFVKFGWEILLDQKALIPGTGVGDARRAMEEIKEQYSLYLGNPELGDSGYRGYNFHNQYMELWVQVGIAGLLLFLWIFIKGFQKALKKGNGFPAGFIIFCLFAFAMTESYLERQRGVVFFVYILSTFFVLHKDEAA